MFPQICAAPEDSMPTFRIVSLPALLAVVVACTTKDAPPAATRPDTPSPSAASGREPTANEVSNYRLDMDKMRKWTTAIKGFTALGPQDSAALAAMDMGSNEPTSVMIAKIESNPVAREVLRKAGISAKDYVWIMAAYVQAGMTEAVLSSSPEAKVPEGQNPQNVQFVRSHRAELEELMKDAGMNR